MFLGVCLHWTGPQPPAPGGWGSLAFQIAALNGVAGSSPAVRAFEIRGMAQKLGDFLKDETATAAIEYGLVAAGLAVLLTTGVRPANSSPACPTCGLPMRFVATIPKFNLYPELRAYKCRKCEETALEEWGQGKRGCTSRRQPLLPRFFLARFAAQFLGMQSEIQCAERDLMIMPLLTDHFKQYKAALIAGYDIACGVRHFFAWFASDIIRQGRSVIQICRQACHRGLHRAVAAAPFWFSIITNLFMEAYRNLFMAITFPIRLVARILIAMLPQV